MEEVYPACRRMLDPKIWARIVQDCREDSRPDSIIKSIEQLGKDAKLPGFLRDLAKLEWALYEVSNQKIEFPKKVDQLQVNPTLQLLQVSWSHLPSILKGTHGKSISPKDAGKEFVLLWRDSKSGHPRCKSASDEDLLALKLVVERIDSREAAAAGKVQVGAIDNALRRAVARGILLSPPSRIRRNTSTYSSTQLAEDKFISTSVFTLQWHITQECDLRCKHCYDRSNRSDLSLEQGLALLDDLRTFCRERHVRGQVSFTGGNPLLHPYFLELYQAASDRGMATAILGNPASQAKIEEILEIARPVYFQVSLEGLRDHNDAIRGRGSYDRTIEFLKLLRQFRIPSKVMLTLTQANMDQVIRLGQLLQGLADGFTFNRLSQVGEGAGIQAPSKAKYDEFLKEYMRASRENRIMGWKDNLINIVCLEKGIRAFGGCTGYGCGAAFNFISVLSDGEAHACRKFPSPIGNVLNQSLSDIYNSPQAERYRSGPDECNACSLRLICRGCLASTFSYGLDVFKDRDPYCFMDDNRNGDVFG